jgi:hypothetical protein
MRILVGWSDCFRERTHVERNVRSRSYDTKRRQNASTLFLAGDSLCVWLSPQFFVQPKPVPAILNAQVTSRKTAALLAAALAAFVGLLLWSVHRPEPPDIGQTAPLRIPLPLRISDDYHYEWAGTNELLFVDRHGGTYEMISVDLNSGQKQSYDALAGFLTDLWQSNQESRSGRSYPPERFAPYVSPDKTTVAVVINQNDHASIRTANEKSPTCPESNSLPGFRTVLDFDWIGSGEGWVAVGRIAQSNDTPVAMYRMKNSQPQESVLPDRHLRAVGVTPESHLICLDERPYEQDVSRPEALELELDTSAHPTREWTMQLPFECAVHDLTLSPTGQQIAWLLSRTSKFRLPKITADFPYVGFEEPVAQRSIWISRRDGTDFVFMGSLPPNEGWFLEWSPDGSRISILLQSQVCILPIPGIK